ncbi:hypothetical protein niasHT_008330 [Heterodera trifolii]|uniref:RING-type domain-containing protein n=1 Tax=Heterodera trifolii TaxID=157864 RepID=A0ABD2M210_9BILA
MACNICFDDIKIDQLCFCDDPSCKTDKPDNDRTEETHAICIECLRRYTKAAHSTMPFASGLGLSCVALNCQNPIRWDTLKKRLTKDKKSIKSINGLMNLSERCIAKFGGGHIERCPKCDCAVDMSEKQKEKHLKCPSCKYEMCRECEMEKHDNLSCLQYAKCHNRLEQLMQRHLDKVAIDKCPKCHIKFVWTGGCNFVKFFFIKTI